MKNISSLVRDNGSLQMEYPVRHLNHETKKIVLPVANGLIVVAVKDIIRCESDGNYTLFFFTCNKKMLLVSKSLCEYEKILSPYDFCRVHDKHLVNLHCIIHYSYGEGGLIKMCDSSAVDVSRRKREEFLMLLGEI